MNSKSRILLLLALWAVALPVGSDTLPGGDDRQGPYEYRTPSRDGIGKVYMGREISFVLGHLGIEWLERRSIP
jgi:hypothetical protein